MKKTSTALAISPLFDKPSLFFLVFFFCFVLQPLAVLATGIPITVEVTDSGSGNVASGPTTTLAAAISIVNANPSGGTVDLSQLEDATIDLSLAPPLPALNANVTIQNSGTPINIVGSLTGVGNVAVLTNGSISFTAPTDTPVSVVGTNLTVSNSNPGLLVNGGTGDATGGNGGSAALSLTGSQSIDAGSVSVVGGDASLTTVTGQAGNGGDAAVTSGSITLIDNSNYQISGGMGGFSSTLVSGAGGVGSLSAGAVSVDASTININGGSSQQGDAVTPVTEGVGGNASATLGSLTLNGDITNDDGPVFTSSNLNLGGGAGGTDAGNGNGGAGGAASLQVNGVTSVDSAYISAMGGHGGIGSGVSGSLDGNGGDASVSLGSLTFTSNTFNQFQGNPYDETTNFNLTIQGGMGGSELVTGLGAPGNGGSATLLTSGSVSIDTNNVNVIGGAGGDGYTGVSGSGGNAAVSIGSGLTLTGTYGSSSLNIFGGASGQMNSVTGLVGAAGSASLTVSGPISIDSSTISVNGGSTDDGYGNIGDTEGAGGSAFVSAGSLTITSNAAIANAEDTVLGASTFSVTGRNGGNDWANGNGGLGGSAALTISQSMSVDSGFVTVGGGNGGFSNTGQAGSGGDAAISIGSNFTLTSNNLESLTSNLVLTGGNGGAGGIDSGVGAGGNGGAVSLIVGGTVSVDSSNVSIAGGAGGESYAGDGGAGGDVWVSIGGGLTMTSNNESLSNFNVSGGTGGVANYFVDGPLDGEPVTGTTEAGVNNASNAGNDYTGGSVTGGSISGNDGMTGGNNGNGGAVNFTVSAPTSIDSSSVNITGGNAVSINQLTEEPVGVGGTGGNGGVATGGTGNGGSGTGTNNPTGVGGDGTGGTGTGGDATGGAGGTGGYGGDGGAVTLSMSDSTIADDSSFNITGGNGGQAGQGGTGGTGIGGTGNGGVGTGGNGFDGENGASNPGTGIGGDGFGGIGGNGGVGGNGGAVSATFGALTVTNDSQLNVTGGNGGVGGTGGTGGEGDGGQGINGDELAGVSGIGNEGFGGAGGNGGNGGSVTVSANSVTLDSSTISITGGNGGDGGAGGFSNVTEQQATNGNGGTGGDANFFTTNTVDLNNGSNITLTGGTGASGFNGGNGGNANFSAQTLNFWDTDSSLTVTGGNGENTGIVFVNIGSLNSEGVSDGMISISGNGAILQVGSGNYSGVITGTMNLDVVASGGALTLTGNNTYAGSTTVSGGAILNISSDNNISTFEGTDLTLDGGTLQANSAGLTLNQNLNLTGNGGIFDTDGASSTIFGMITDNGNDGSFVVEDTVGGGVLYLRPISGNEYFGDTTLEGGTLNIDNADELGFGDLFFEGGTLQAGANLNLAFPDAVYNYGGAFDVNGNASTITNSVLGDGALTILDSSENGGSLNVVGANGINDSESEIDSPGQAVTFESSSLVLNPYNAEDADSGSGVTLNVLGGTGADGNVELGSAIGTDGGAVSVAAGDLAMDSSVLNIQGGNAGSGEASSDSLAEGAGGDASVSLTSLNETSNTYYVFEGTEFGNASVMNVVGGNGGNDNGMGIGGNGGNASLTVSGPAYIDSSTLNVIGGTGGYGYGTTIVTGNGAEFTDYISEGAGGSASVSVGPLTITSDDFYSLGDPEFNSASSLSVLGGQGGSVSIGEGSFAAGGAGGSASLIGGAVEVDSSNVTVMGGNAGSGNAADGTVVAGVGGNALVSIDSLNLTANYNFVGVDPFGQSSNFDVLGGQGGIDEGFGDGGQGGDASLVVNGYLGSDSSNLIVAGGTGGNGSGSAKSFDGNGGDASVTVGSLALTNSWSDSENGKESDINNNLIIIGGNGSDDTSNGMGGNGGDASLVATGSSSIDSSFVSVGGGGGGASENGDSEQTDPGVNGGSGGSAFVSIGSLNLTSNNNTSSLDVIGGDGGGAGVGEGYGETGNGGDATLMGGMLTIDSSSVVVAGGSSGSTSGGWSPDDTFTQGIGGNASVSLGCLTLTSDTYYDDEGFGNASSFNVVGGQGGYENNNAGNTGAGGEASLIVNGAVSIDSSSVNVAGGAGGLGGGTETAGDYVTEGAGGSASVSIGSLIITSDAFDSFGDSEINSVSNFSVVGGQGASVSIANVEEEQTQGFGAGGAGGSATLMGGVVEVDSSNVTVAGGAAGSGYGFDDTVVESAGGNAYVSLGGLTLTANYTNEEADPFGQSSNLFIFGGQGGNDNGNGNGGEGGSASLTVSGPVSVDSSNIGVGGGQGGYGFGNGGNGGDASVSFGSSLMLTALGQDEEADSSNLYVVAGNGGEGGFDDENGISGNGGSATLMGGMLTADSSNVSVGGGSGSDGWAPDDTFTEGSGGNASVSLGCLTLTSDSYWENEIDGNTTTFNVVGGQGGVEDNSVGNGGVGGTASLYVSGSVSIDSSSVTVIGGNGGQGSGDIGTFNGNGGDASVSVGSLALTGYWNDSEFEVAGGSDNNEEIGLITGGNGGAATFISAGSVSIDSSEMDVDGGDGGYSANGNGGTGGNASVSIGGSLVLTAITTDNSFLNVVGGDGGGFGEEGNGSDGINGNASLIVSGPVSIDSSAVSIVGGSQTEDNGEMLSGTEPDGGSASVSFGSELILTNLEDGMPSSLSVIGGTGNADSNEGNGGNGGTASLTVSGPVSIDSSTMLVQGGDGGDSSNGNGGAGGNASVSIDSDLILAATNASATFSVNGGNSGLAEDAEGITVGNGGSATLIVNGAVSIDSGLISVMGSLNNEVFGNGNSGAEGTGGNASVSLGSLIMNSNSFYSDLDEFGTVATLTVSGGQGGGDNNVADGGAGGTASLIVDGPVSINASFVNVTGGVGGDGSEGNGGAGGNASVSFGSQMLLMGDDPPSQFNVGGGKGGDSIDSNAGNGGSASLILAGPVSVDSSSISVYGGVGGDESNGIGFGGNGGNATVDAGIVELNDVASINVVGGNGGFTDDGEDYGLAGNASVTISSLNLIDAASYLNVQAGVDGSGAVTGSASVSIGALYGAGSVTVNGGSQAVLQVASGNFSGSINGNTSLDKVGIGALTLSGNSTYTGGTTLSQGLLNLASNNALGTGTLNLETTTTLQAGVNDLAVANAIVLNGDDTYDTNGVTSTLSGTISGTGGLAVTNTSVGAGVVTISGDNTYSGGTAIDGGTVVATNSNSLGTGVIAVQYDGTLLLDPNVTLSNNDVDLSTGTTLIATDNLNNTIGSLSGSGNVSIGLNSFTVGGDNNNTLFSGIISGSGGLVKTGSGALTLTGANTYTGATTVTSGLLAVDNGTLGSSNWVSVGGLGTLDFVNSTTAASLTIENSGLVQFSNSSNAGSATINNNDGTIYFTGTSSAQSATITNTLGWVTFDTNATGGSSTIQNYSGVNFAGNSNAVSAVINNQLGAELQFSNTSKAGNATITNNGNVYFTDGSSAYNATITNNTSGWLVFNTNASADAATVQNNGGVIFYGNANGGTAAFTEGAGSMLDIGQSNGVTVGSVTGSGTINLGFQNLGVGVNNADTTFSGAVTGGSGIQTGGSLTKLGTGTLTLSGVGDYGDTNIDAGTLVVANPNALGVGNMNVNGGTLSTDGVNHAITVFGNYAQSANGILSLGFGGAPSTLTGLNANNDFVSVGGNVSLNGTLQLTSYSSFTPTLGDKYLILYAGSISGDFSSINESFTGVKLVPVYFPTDVFLITEPTSFAQYAVNNANQLSVANALNNLSGRQASTLLVGLANVKASDYSQVFNQISPSNMTSLYSTNFQITQLQAGALNGRMASFLSGRNYSGNNQTASIDSNMMFASTMSAEEELQMAFHSEEVKDDQRWGGFVSGDSGTLNVNGNGEGYNAVLNGVTAGADYQVNKDMAFGLMVAYQNPNVTSNSGSVLAMNGGEVGLYGMAKSNGLYASILGEGGYETYNSQRVAFGGTAQGNTNGLLYSGQLGLGYQIQADNWTVGPIGSVQYTMVNVNGFQETGSLSPESFGYQGQDSLISNLGAQATGNLNLDKDMTLSPMVSATWLQEYDSQGGSIASSVGGSPFTVQGAPIGQSGIEANASLGVEWKSGLSLSAHYQGQFDRTNFDSQTFGGEMKFKL